MLASNAGTSAGTKVVSVPNFAEMELCVADKVTKMLVAPVVARINTVVLKNR